MYKSNGADVIEENTLYNAWQNNPDGAGIAVVRKKETLVLKGFLEFDEFFYAIESLKLKKQSEYVIHFRFATHGSVSAKNCHPFIVSKYLEDVEMVEALTRKKVLAHNGIISNIPRLDISDSMEYILEHHELINKNLLSKQKGSKFALIENGKVNLVGSWLYEDGIYYSNDSYKDFEIKKSYWNWEVDKDLPDTCPTCGSVNIDDTICYDCFANLEEDKKWNKILGR